MARSKAGGFRYYLTDEALLQYRKKPMVLRLQWLYMANVLRKGCDKRTIKIQDGFRQGRM